MFVPVLSSIIILLSACNQDWDQDGVKKRDDCDDESSLIYPGAPEICDGIDNDCDDLIDEEDELSLLVGRKVHRDAFTVSKGPSRRLWLRRADTILQKETVFCRIHCIVVPNQNSRMLARERGIVDESELAPCGLPSHDMLTLSQIK